MIVQFFVAGTPQPGGSKRAFVNRKTGRAVVTEDCAKNKDWRADVRTEAAKHFARPLNGPIDVICTFYRLRPKGHYRTGKNSHLLRDDAPGFPITKPDTTKLFRSTEDALTGIAWHDDAQVVNQIIRKRYGDQAGAVLVIRDDAVPGA